MATKLQRWGNSIGLRIPKAVADKANLGENSEVEVEHRDGTIIILPVKKVPLLKDLLKGINDSNLHEEDDFCPEGREIW